LKKNIPKREGAETGRETQRLRRVYDAYERSRRIKRQWSDEAPGNIYSNAERNKVLMTVLKNNGCRPFSEAKILDVGCGDGKLLSVFLDCGARPENLYGVDLLGDRIKKAQLEHPGIYFKQANAERMDFPGQTFDVILFFTVFSSILDDAMSANIVREALRVLKKCGLIAVYDVRYNNPFNPNTRPLGSAWVKKHFSNAVESRFYSLTLMPPLARCLAPLSFKICFLLEKIPLLRSHYLVIIRKV
jgi:SAM-dependent methyltransferase